jgi:hypothetical protein
MRNVLNKHCRQNQNNQIAFFNSYTVHLDTIRVFIYQQMHNRVALKEY